MAWIKSNPHLLTLLLVAVAVLGASGLLVMNAQGFSEKFAAAQENPAQGSKVYEQDLKAVVEAEGELQKPATWEKDDAKNGSLFVADLYMIDQTTQQPIRPGAGSLWKDSLTGKEIPNEWFLKNKLALFNPAIAKTDSDNDGFLNEDEWRENPSTDPNDPKSHPPYTSRLFLVQYKKVPFLLKFQSWDGDPAKQEEMSFQINTLSLRQPSAFLKIGDMVSKTKFKITKFEKKAGTNALGVEDDLSELTLLDTEFNNEVVLVMNKVTDSPDSYAIFAYLWGGTRQNIEVKKGGPFVLKPVIDQRYKLLDISDQEAQIQAPSGEKVTIPRLPAGYPK